MIMKNLMVLKKILTREFQNVKSARLLNMLGVVDDLCILFKTQDFHNVQTFTDILRGDICFLFKEKIEDEYFFLFQMLSNNKI